MIPLATRRIVFLAFFPLLASCGSQHGVAFLVHAYSERTIRINITAPESQIEKIDRLAQSAGLTRSAFLVPSAIQSRPAKAKKHKAKKVFA